MDILAAISVRIECDYFFRVRRNFFIAGAAKTSLFGGADSYVGHEFSLSLIWSMSITFILHGIARARHCKNYARPQGLIPFRDRDEDGLDT